MSVISSYSPDIQKAWATVFACAWVHQSKHDNSEFHNALVNNPKEALEGAISGKYTCSEYDNPSLKEAATLIITNGYVLPFPEAPTIDNLHAEQLRQFFDQEGITGILRFT